MWGLPNMRSVLVAIPYRTSTPRVFIGGIGAAVINLTHPIELAFHPNCVVDTQRHYGANAQARNELIAEYLRPHHTHVLWLDVDLVKVPPNLIETLLTVSQTDIVAPLVFVEKLDAHKPAGFDNGGWFYDTGGFVRDGEATDAYSPYWTGYHGGEIELDSVGCCYLIPADVYRAGGQYDPVGDEVEHRSLMRFAKRLGYRVIATDKAIVEHAYLPRYGQKWNNKQ